MLPTVLGERRVCVVQIVALFHLASLKLVPFGPAEAREGCRPVACVERVLRVLHRRIAEAAEAADSGGAGLLPGNAREAFAMHNSWLPGVRLRAPAEHRPVEASEIDAWAKA
jgi:hypothetical protein